MTAKKKLIEVALPLDAINAASAKEKSLRHGHPSTLHLWWARRPLAACRAVVFASLVDDPSAHPEKLPTEEAQDAERERLFDIIRDLVKWENSNNPQVIRAARAEISRSCGDAPPVLDPFCGGGSIPLEAQRLGLEVHASDINPVAVLITKGLIEVPPKFAGRPPVNPDWQKVSDTQKAMTPWSGAAGLTEDIRWYGQWMRDQAEKRIGHLYPKITVTRQMAKSRRDLAPVAGEQLTVIAWIWARTVQCPHPDCRGRTPLAKSFWLSMKKDRKAWVDPVIDRDSKSVHFEVRTGKGEPSESPKTGRGAKFRCLLCKKSIEEEHIKEEGAAKRMGAQLMAVATEGQKGRVYLSPTTEQEELAASASPAWAPTQELSNDPRNLWCIPYGLRTFADLFTPRQTVAMTTFCDLVGEARELALQHAKAAKMPVGKRLAEDGTGAAAYADAVTLYLAFALDKSADFWSSLATWSPQPKNELVVSTFRRQALPMTWDFAEANPFSESGGNFVGNLGFVAKVVANLVADVKPGKVRQENAIQSVNGAQYDVISTDPPYYDNIGYADLSDYFYVWLRRSLATVFPNLLGVIVTPKQEELIASPYRFEGDKGKAEKFFEENLGRVFGNMLKTHHPDYPLALFYAFKQSETDEDDSDGELPESASPRASTGWETMLEGLIRSEFQITGTWPMRTERAARSISLGTNALASSIVLVCRPRPDAKVATRREFLAALKRELPDALKRLQRGNIAPVDLAQAAIGPGMAIYSRYKRIVESEGHPLPVRTALQLINQALDEVLSEQDSEYDSHTRFALAWFEQYALDAGPFGEAEVLARAKDCALSGLVQAGVLSSRAGKVRLLKREELEDDWSPAGRQPYVWEATQHLIRALEKDGEAGAAAVLREIGSLGEVARDLAYRLYNTCEKKRWAEEARAYNSLVIAWPEVDRLSRQPTSLPKGKADASLFDDTDE